MRAAAAWKRVKSTNEPTNQNQAQRVVLNNEDQLGFFFNWQNQTKRQLQNVIE